MRGFADLVAATNFSFLRGASSPAEMVAAALQSGLAGLGVCDRNSVAGVVRAHSALKALRENGLPPGATIRDSAGMGAVSRVPAEPLEMAVADVMKRAAAFRLVVGARLVFEESTTDVAALPVNREGWGRLSRLLTLGKRRARKGECSLRPTDLLFEASDMLLIALPHPETPPPTQFLAQLREACPGAVWLGATMHRRGDDRRRLAQLSEVAQAARLPLLATNDALYATPEDRDLQDVVTCIREGVRLEAAGRLLAANAERHVKSPREMRRLFVDAPHAVEETMAALARIDFSLDQLRYEYPDEPTPPGRGAQEWLEELTWRHAPMRYPEGVPAKVETLLREELSLIARLDYARYFLTIHDIVRMANDMGILCQGRGSAANSAVCYVLGVTCVDPAEHDLLFARFISQERGEPPDIDVDFEHERREEVIQRIYEKYGRERAGLAATVISYRPRSAIREVGKAFGLSEDVTGALAGAQWGQWGRDIPNSHVRQAGFDPSNPTLARVVAFAHRLIGAPRHLSQHVGGFVLTRGRLDEIVPIGNAAMADRTFIEWDKDDIDALGLMKVDILALGMLTCIRKAFDELRRHDGVEMGLADVTADDEATFAMLQKGDSIGVFQVESRAQINMLPRLKPKEFYDLVIQVAIVRPGPIQGNMVHPYLRRRKGAERPALPSPSPEHGPPDELEKVLGRTLGVPLFQEQAMKIAMVAAKFSDVEANQLRRAMATFRHVGTIHRFETMMVDRMIARGYDPAFARDCFEQIKGFGSYGFPESHAASFAKLVYISAWLKRHHPAAFACALLNSQPMGFYAPAQIVRDAVEHGVETRAPDVNRSDWDNMLTRRPDGALALQLGLRQVDGLSEADMRRLVERRGAGYADIEDMMRRAGTSPGVLRKLADADALRSLGAGPDRREALWETRRAPAARPLPLFEAAEARELAAEPPAQLPDMSLGEEVATDYQTIRLSLRAHPMKLLRPHLPDVSTAEGLRDLRDGARAKVAGLVLVRQRPGKGNAIFVTLEDETGVANLVLWARLFERFRRETMSARLMLAEGRVQKSAEGVVHLMTERVVDRSALLLRLWREEDRTSGAGDAPPSSARHPRDMRVLSRSRDFH
ncbi:MAG: error-prone DNA polymerase [Rhizobiales bacterium]|nr:error-prone DNA polymerase [Hyphomicrobiales bacterium]